MAINLGRHFRAPAADNASEWQKVTFLVQRGFVFQTIHDPETGLRVGYPATLREAKQFVRKYRSQALRSSGPQNNEMQRTTPGKLERRR